MEVIIVDKKEFEDIFDAIDHEYTYKHTFMQPDETLKDFEKTDRWQMLQTFKSTLFCLKRDLLKA